jgi:hypothetical protein
MLSQWQKCTLPILTRQVHWPVRIRNRGSNDTVRKSEKIPIVSCIYWPINGPAAMHVVLTENKRRCFQTNKQRFTKCDHATLRPLSSQIKAALSWTHYPSVKVGGVTNKTNPFLYGFKMGNAKFEALTAVLKGVQYSDTLALSTGKHQHFRWTCYFHPEGLTVLEAALKRWKLFTSWHGETPHKAWIFIIGYSRRWNRLPHNPII